MALIRINKNPSRGQLAVFGIAWLAFLGLCGWASWHRGRHLAAEGLWVAAAAVPLAGMIIPGFLRLVYLATSYLTYPVGFAVSYAVLVLSYYLAIAPIGLTMRLFRHDPLSRRFDPAVKTYWRERRGTKTPEDYFSQS